MTTFDIFATRTDTAASWRREGRWMVKRDPEGRPLAWMSCGAWVMETMAWVGLSALRETARIYVQERARHWLHREDLDVLEPLAERLIDRVFDSPHLAVRPL